MGLYIKDIWLPEDPNEIIEFAVKGNGAVFVVGEHYWPDAVEVPEQHGRLIDADALVEDMKRQCEEVFKIDAVSPDDFWITRDQAYNERLWKTWCESFFEYLKTRETIIPASEEG